ncbi:MAG TPA: phosphodiester glycosidase family protein [Chthoniobacterales bacterium]
MRAREAGLPGPGIDDSIPAAFPILMKPCLLLVSLLFAFAFPAAGEWVAVSSDSEAASVPGLIHRHIELKNAATDEFAALDLALFPASAKKSLRVIDNPSGSLSLAEALRDRGCVAGVNGGYFDPGFAPIGLRVMDDKIVRPMVRARLMTGVLFSAGGSLEIARVGEYARRRNVTAAVQCGPLLVEGGKPVKGLDETRSARRTFALVGADRGALGFCPGASLGGLAALLTSPSLARDLKIQRALNLDGGSSSAFWFKRADGSAFSISEQKNVRDFVGIAAR